MTELPFASFCNRYAGRTGWVVGRGPTRFRYDDLRHCSGPVFFVNDAVGQETWLPGDTPSFFFAHDSSMECWLLEPRRRSIPVLIADQPVTGPDECRVRGLIGGPADPLLARVRSGILYTRAGTFARDCLLGRSREEIASAAQLYTANGTLMPLIHFAWYVGCACLRLVGCDGLAGEGYDGRLENRSRSVQRNAMHIRIGLEEMLGRLSLTGTCIGGAPHRISMIIEARVGAQGHAAFLEWSALMVSLLRKGGCESLAVTDSVNRSGTAWINGEWPDADTCARGLSSAGYRGLAGRAGEFLSGDPATSFQLAFKARPLGAAEGRRGVA